MLKQNLWEWLVAAIPDSIAATSHSTALPLFGELDCY